MAEVLVYSMSVEEREKLAHFLVDEMGCKLHTADMVRNPQNYNMHKVVFKLIGSKENSNG
jgi:hypothetical protein